jgi:predicted RNA binding protein YcfA (HicA-like mRNA interferase family)
LSKLPVVPFRTMEKVLRAAGFESVRQRGSHVFYRRVSDGRTTTLPNHGKQDIARPLIREILREADITPEQYLELLEKV